MLLDSTNNTKDTTIHSFNDQIVLLLNDEVAVDDSVDVQSNSVIISMGN